MDLDDAIHTWLTKIIDPLVLPSDFMNRILKSAQDASARVFQSEAEGTCDHIHLVIYGPLEQEAKPGTWGFLRVEKIENAAEEPWPAAHSIEFYLYKDGHS
jgi:hypothetical protein